MSWLVCGASTWREEEPDHVQVNCSRLKVNCRGKNWAGLPTVVGLASPIFFLPTIYFQSTIHFQLQFTYTWTGPKKQQHQQIMDRQQELLRLLLLVVYQGWNVVQIPQMQEDGWWCIAPLCVFSEINHFWVTSVLGDLGSRQGKHIAIFEINLTLRFFRKNSVCCLSGILLTELEKSLSKWRKYHFFSFRLYSISQNNSQSISITLFSRRVNK